MEPLGAEVGWCFIREDRREDSSMQDSIVKKSVPNGKSFEWDLV